MKWAINLYFCAKITNEWSCTFTLCICLHGADRDNFTLYRIPLCKAVTNHILSNDARVP